MSNQILLSESKQKLRDRETMRSVWLNQSEKAEIGRTHDMLASLI